MKHCYTCGTRIEIASDARGNCVDCADWEEPTNRDDNDPEIQDLMKD